MLRKLVNKHYIRFLVILFILNLIDAIFTVILIDTGRVYEVNPLMNYVLSYGYSEFFFVKIFVVTLGIALLYRCKVLYNSVTAVGMLLMISLYTAIICSHLFISYRIFLS